MTTNEHTFHASSAALHAGRIEEFLAYWTDTPRYEVAYPIDGMPAVVEGREQFAALFGGFATLATSISVHDVRFHHTLDPDLAFVEERMVAELAGGGRYENRLVMRVSFRDGRIAEMLEYYGERAHEALIARVAAAGAEAGR
jgi:ketosteroid isomerase-like protein